MTHALPLLKLLVATAALAISAHAAAVTLVECPFKGNGDDLSRGFYVQDVDAVTLSTVTLGHAAVTPGDRTIVLTARRNAYNGGVIGRASCRERVFEAV